MTLSPGTFSRPIKLALLFLLGLAVVQACLAFLFLRPAVGFQDPSAARIIAFHLPMAWLCTLWFIVSAVYAVRYLRSRRLEDDVASAGAAGIGLLCCVLATASGSVFAHTQWGSWWNWDPRETSIFYLLLIYGAYFALRGSVEDVGRRATFSGVYALLACLVMPFLIFVLPRMFESLHPSRAHLEGSYWLVVFVGLFGLGAYLVWCFLTYCAMGRYSLTQGATEEESAGILRPTLVQDRQPVAGPVASGDGRDR